ncbi:uncharacterized protein LOC132935958 [Metopolophium dirhodum]|uniref:uncharacterized protein LOC132935958 n=1 Tax=Metopolophium dirhodum TaxID=44670 RepID=UPI00298F76C7|nr:uncharacterized protein LOC132935958 [Metopolophium dirhodum]
MIYLVFFIVLDKNTIFYIFVGVASLYFLFTMSDIEDTPEVFEEEGPSTPKKKRSLRNELSKHEKEKHRKQKYREEWESNKEFKGWLKPERDNPFKAKCIMCNVSFVSELSCIKKHCNSSNHIKSLKSSSHFKNIMLNFQVMAKSNPLNNSVKTAEIKLSALLAEHNVAFSLINHLEPLLKEIFPDSKICKEMKLKRTKATNIITNVIAPVEKEMLSLKLNKSKFSIMIDESTDVACISTMCTVVRFFDTESKIIVTRFWDLVQVFDVKEPETVDKGATSENLFSKCIQSFENHNVDVKNIVGFGSDGCSTMMGSKNSVSSRLKITFPGIFVMKCICHSLHLCCSEACKSLPRRIEDFARNVFNFFSHSSKRQSQYIEFQNFFNISVHKLLHPSQTRWLSLFAVVQRILEQWMALHSYFNEKWFSEKLVAAENIYTQLNDPFTKMYFFFLEWVLPKFSALNQYFQTEQVVLNNLNEKMELVYKELLLCYMKRDYVLQTPLATLNPADQSKFMSPSEVYLGVKVLTHTKTPAIVQRPDLLKEFISRCVDFLKVSCVQIKKTL